MDFTSTCTGLSVKTEVSIQVLRERGWKTIIKGLDHNVTGKRSPTELLSYLKKSLCSCNGSLQVTKEAPESVIYILHGDHRQVVTKYLESVGCRDISVIGST